MSFAIDLSIYNDLKKTTEDEVKKLAFVIDRRLVLETPKDTSNAASNWLVGWNYSPEYVISFSGDGRSGAVTKGAATISTCKGFGRMFINNSTPYITRLNEGWSKKADPYFIDIIINETVNASN